MKNSELIQKCIDNKWTSLLNGDMPIRYSIRSSNCLLCEIYYELDDSEIDCNICPIRAKTGKPHCKSTPVFNLIRLYEKSTDKLEMNVEFSVAIQDEIDFLYEVMQDELLKENAPKSS